MNQPESANLHIRPAAAADAKAICRLNAEEMGYRYPEAQTAEKLAALGNSGRDKIFVALLGGHVVGYIHASSYDALYAPHLKNILGIAVSAKARGRGIGRALLAAVEEWAQQTGAAGVRLVSGAARTGAHAFYRRCGYTGEKEQINFKKMF